MFNREQKIRRISAKISEEKIREIKIYIISAVRTFCANNLEGDGTSQWFAVHTFFGDKNYYIDYFVLSEAGKYGLQIFCNSSSPKLLFIATL